jgi:hypothetical protein
VGSTFSTFPREAAYLKTVRTRGNIFGVCVDNDLNRVFAALAGRAVAVIDIDPASPTFDTVVARIDTGGRGATTLIEYVPSLKKPGRIAVAPGLRPGHRSS